MIFARGVSVNRVRAEEETRLTQRHAADHPKLLKVKESRQKQQIKLDRAQPQSLFCHCVAARATGFSFCGRTVPRAARAAAWVCCTPSVVMV